MDRKTVDRWQLVVGRFGLPAAVITNALRRSILFLALLFSAFFVKAQDLSTKKEAADMATGMRSNGKIYVVVAVLCIILAGIFIYLINLDRKIGKLEKEINVK